MIHPLQASGKASGDVHELVAAITHTRGVMGSVWKSTLTIVNEKDDPQSAELVFQPEPDRNGVVGESIERSVTISPNEQMHWDDVLVELFGVSNDAKMQGSLHVYSPEGLMITSRPYNVRGDGGTHGLVLPAFKQGDMISLGQSGSMGGLKHTQVTRTNLGLAEFSGNDVTVEIVLADTEGNFTWLHDPDDTITLTIPGGSHKQITKVFEKIDAGEVEWHSVQAFVRVTMGGSVYAYATVIDNQSGDATSVFTAER
jgi:hypothetical protein